MTARFVSPALDTFTDIFCARSLIKNEETALLSALGLRHLQTRISVTNIQTIVYIDISSLNPSSSQLREFVSGTNFYRNGNIFNLQRKLKQNSNFRFLEYKLMYTVNV